MESGSGKGRLLLIAPLFFDYYKAIMSEARNMGYETEYVCDAPSNSNLSKAIGRVNKNLLRTSVDKYYRQKVLPFLQKNRFDHVLVVAGMTFSFTPKMVGEMRALYPDARFVLYQWDSEKNLPYVTAIQRYFDAIYSFDKGDCARREIYRFLPLFYTREYGEIGSEAGRDFKYDCAYVGTAHPLKYKNINEMSRALKQRLPRQFIYHYMPSYLKYFYHKLKAPEYKGARLSDFRFEKVSKAALLELIRESRCILDSPQFGQTGLTIRSIECLGAKRKLITTNPEIREYDFYNEKNVFIYTDAPDLDSAFFTEPYEEIDAAVYRKYSLNAWLGTMLEGRAR